MYLPNEMHSNEVDCIKNPILTCEDVTDVNASYVADPFLFIQGPNDPWYLFFEVSIILSMNNIQVIIELLLGDVAFAFR